MRRIARTIGWIGAFAVGAAVLWLVAGVLTDRGLQAGLSALRAAGWQVDADFEDTGGTPPHLTTELRNLRVIFPRGAALASADTLTLRHAVTHPGRIAVHPAAQADVLFPQFGVRASAAVLGELDVAPLPPFSIDGATIGVEALSIRNPFWSDLTLASSNLDLVGLGDGAYRLAAMAREARLDGLPVPPADALTIDATLSFAEDLVATRATPRLLEVTLSNAVLIWADATLSASGTLSVDEDGALMGRLMLELDGWESAIDQSASAGFLTPQGEAQLRLQGRLLAELSGSDTAIITPLAIENGRMFLGPFPIGPAPQLY